MPSFVHISKAKMHDSRALALLRLNPGSIVAMDRAYNDYAQFARWCEAGVFFVTRMKENAVYDVVEQREVPKYRNILSDEIIVLTGNQAQKKCPHKLRRIVVWDEENEREIVLLTKVYLFLLRAIALSGRPAPGRETVSNYQDVAAAVEARPPILVKCQ